jgi:signal recognition particle subunit SRP19
VWLDYFNKNLSRSRGRKVKRDLAVFEPSINQLIEAAKASGYDPISEEINDHCRYPRRPFVRSGYIMLPKVKDEKKRLVVQKIARMMLQKYNKG